MEEVYSGGSLPQQQQKLACKCVHKTVGPAPELERCSRDSHLSSCYKYALFGVKSFCVSTRVTGGASCFVCYKFIFIDIL